MSVLIKDMEMPKHGDVLVVREYNGKTYIKHEGHLGFEGILSKIPIPHGRLIDADEMIRIWDGATFEGSIKPLIEARPTVIEAEGRE